MDLTPRLRLLFLLPFAPRAGARHGGARVTGQLIAGSRSYFSEREFIRIRDAVGGTPAIAGLVPAIVEPMVAGKATAAVTPVSAAPA